MAKNRVTRKHLLKAPDEFLTTTAKGINWAKENTRSLIIGTSLFFGVVLFVSFYTYFQERRNNTAEVVLGAALARYQTQIEAQDPSAALASVRSDFESLIGSYGSLPAGRLGSLIFGHICLAARAYDEAIAHYQVSLSHFGAESSLGNVILNGLATAYQQKGDYPGAVEQFKKVAAGVSPVLKDAALFNLGRLYEQLGQVEARQKVYRQLEADFPGSMYANLVKEKITG